MTDTPTIAAPTLGELLARKAELRAEIDRRQAEIKPLSDESNQLDRAILEAMTAQGLGDDGSKFSAAGLTVAVREKLRTTYEPEKWGAIVAWAASTGHDYLIQRRLSDAKVIEFVTTGGGKLPDGLSLEPYTALEFRAASK